MNIEGQLPPHDHLVPPHDDEQPPSGYGDEYEQEPPPQDAAPIELIPPTTTAASTPTPVSLPSTRTQPTIYIDMENKVDYVYAPGFDMSTTEETQKRLDRMKRFQLNTDAHNNASNEDGSAPLNSQQQQLDYQAQRTQYKINKLSEALQDAEIRKTRLARFCDNDTTTSITVPTTSTMNNMNTDSNASTVSKRIPTVGEYETMTNESLENYPQIMDYEQLQEISENQIQCELCSFNPLSQRRFDTVHLFGTRLLAENHTTESLLKKYASYGVRRIEWLSDWRCNLVFCDESSAKRMLTKYSTPLGLDVAAAKKHFLFGDNDSEMGDFENITHENGGDIINQDAPSISSASVTDETITSAPKTRPFKVKDENELAFIVWRRANSDQFSRGSLSMRLATVDDLKEPLEERTESQFYLQNKSYFYNLVELRKRAQVYPQHLNPDFSRLEKQRIARQNLKSGNTAPHRHHHNNNVNNMVDARNTVSEQKIITTSKYNEQLGQQPQHIPTPFASSRPAPSRNARGRGFAPQYTNTAHTTIVVTKSSLLNGDNNNLSEITGRQRDRSYGENDGNNQPQQSSRPTYNRLNRLQPQKSRIETVSQVKDQNDILNHPCDVNNNDDMRDNNDDKNDNTEGIETSNNDENYHQEQPQHQQEEQQQQSNLQDEFNDYE